MPYVPYHIKNLLKLILYFTVRLNSIIPRFGSADVVRHLKVILARLEWTTRFRPKCFFVHLLISFLFLYLVCR